MELDHWLVVVVVGLMALRSLWMSMKDSKKAEESLKEAVQAGRHEPPSLHPSIRQELCIGCGACVKACPEKNVLGLIEGQAALINAAACVGHGACAVACPASAIDLVLGTERRGLDIPDLRPDYQTNVEGLYVAGELGGMGLIRNAVRQGALAVRGIEREADGAPEAELELLVVGAGPAGLAAALAAKEQGLRFKIVEQESELGGSILHFPRRKLVMSTDVILPIYGKIRAQSLGKEELLGIWKDVIAKTGLEIEFGVRVEEILRPQGGGFDVRTNAGDLRARRVILAIGRRGTPRKLGVPGEDRPKVVYRLLEPEAYAGLACLVVGGGDSALEAASALSEQPDCSVTLSYRGDSLFRAKRQNLERVERAARAGRLDIVLNSEVQSIGEEVAILKVGSETRTLQNDAVLVFAGGILPTPFLEKAGIVVRTVRGEKVQAT